MITLEDLEFKLHPAGLGGTQATVNFPNGYGASVVTGRYCYSRPGYPYEIAVIKTGIGIDYTTPITDDVCGYLSEEEANDILRQIQELPLAENENA